MPYEVTLDQLPAGYCLESIKGPGEVSVQYMEFTSSEDGQHFIQRLEGFPSDLLKLVPDEWDRRAYGVHQLVAVIRQDRTASVHINDLPLYARIQSKRAVKRGEQIMLDDMADMYEVSFGDLDVPTDAGLLVIFSCGWRRGMFYDFGPLQVQEPLSREYDWKIMLGRCLADVLFQDRFRITDDEWLSFFDQQWFPFVGLKNQTLQTMLNHIRSNWTLDDLLPVIAEQVRDEVCPKLRRWSGEGVVKSHSDIIQHAVERYCSNDFVSVVSVLYPRIEGLLRSYLSSKGNKSQKMTQANLASAAVKSLQNGHDRSLLLPKAFQQYLMQVYFADFDPQDSRIRVSRNSVAHGTASGGEFSQKAAVIALLMLDQLRYYFSPMDVQNAPN